MQVRLGSADDLAALIELARQFHAEIGDDIFLPFSEAKTASLIRQSISQGLALVVEAADTDEIVGALLLSQYPPAYSEQPALWDSGFYVAQEYRASRGAVLLRDAAKAIAADLGLPLFIAVSSGQDLDRKDKFFTRAGARRIGAVYLWR